MELTLADRQPSTPPRCRTVPIRGVAKRFVNHRARLNSRVRSIGIASRESTACTGSNRENW